MNGTHVTGVPVTTAWHVTGVPVNTALHVTGVPVNTAWHVLKLRMEERLPIWKAAAHIMNK
jgi:hypothetical protein